MPPKKGYDVAAVFPDTMTGSGDFMKRPGMMALLSFLDAQPDESFVVIFDDLKRFARDRDFHFRLRDAFRQRSAEVECLNFNFEDTPEGEFIETIMAAQGQLERKQNARQVSQKMKARMENGYWVHSAPVGYKFRPVKGRGKMLFPDEPCASIVCEAFEGFASGRFATQAEVKRFCASFPDFPRNKNGEVVQQRISDFLSHPIYTGHICSDHYGIHWIKGQHAPLVSLELFEKVQKRRKNASYAPKRANIGEDFALRGVVACACCGTPLRSSWSKGLTKYYAYYLCQTKGCEAYGKSIARDTLEGEVGDVIKSLQPTTGLMDLATAMFKQAWTMRRDQSKSVIASGKHKLAKLDKEIETVLDRIMAASSGVVIQRYESKVDSLERQKAGIVDKLANQKEIKGGFDEKLELALKFLSNPWKIWGKGTIHVRRTVLKLAFTSPIQYCRKEGARTPELSIPFKVLGGVLTEEFFCGADETLLTPISCCTTLTSSL